MLNITLRPVAVDEEARFTTLFDAHHSLGAFYRGMKAANQVWHRGQARAPTHRRPEPLTATGLELGYHLPGDDREGPVLLSQSVPGCLQPQDRRLGGFASESAEQAATVLSRAYHREGVSPATLVLHADNGGSLKGATMLATLQRLGVMPSISRSSVSDDTPFSKALFKTLKYHPGAPSEPCAGLEVAPQWVVGFVDGYNEQHRHSALQFVTPGQRHRGKDRALLDQRRQLYEAARARHPERWSGAIRQWEPVSTVCLNPGRLTKQKANNTSNST